MPRPNRARFITGREERARAGLRSKEATEQSARVTSVLRAISAIATTYDVQRSLGAVTEEMARPGLKGVGKGWR